MNYIFVKRNWFWGDKKVHLLYDNFSSQYIIRNLIQRVRTKYIEIDIYFVLKIYIKKAIGFLYYALDS